MFRPSAMPICEPGWWQDYGDILSEPVEMLIDLIHTVIKELSP